MASILQLKKRVESLDSPDLARDCIDKTKEAIADLNAEQMHKGKRSDGSDILPAYSPLTIVLKKAKGQPTDRVTLRDTGDFYAGITASVSQDFVRITSTDWKVDKLNKKYSTARGNIFGLGGPFKAEYINEHLRPLFMRTVRGKLNL